MSALAAIVAPMGGHAPATESRVRTMLAAMRTLGGEITEAREESTAAASLAVASGCQGWERDLGGSATSIATRGPLVCASDARLYHRADLLRSLGAARIPVTTDAELILATYEKWDVEGFARLEGDFAFVLWDGARSRFVAACDFAGHRTLYHARAGDALLIATSVAGLLADSAVPRELDLSAIATVAAGLWAHAPSTAYRAIDELPAGHALIWSRDSAVRVVPFWHAPDSILDRRQPMAEAAEELRALLVDAVRERLGPSGPTGLSLSGGWDSTAVGGAATIALRGDASRRLLPVSISYPEGDPGREDELIRDVVAHWELGTNWLPVDSIPLLVDADSSARARDLPFGHAYEQWNRALSRRAREGGARVMLDGVGGDQLFQVSDIYLSDLFGQGRWVELARQLKQKDWTGLRDVWRWAVRPALPPVVRAFLARLRGAVPPTHHLHREPPFWFSARFLRTHDLVGRDEAAMPPLPRGSRVLAETHAFLRFPFFARIVSTLRQFALEEGVELRSPLLDDRVVRFAARRPWSERADGRETKILLRRAMSGLLPDQVLAPRPHRTGITSAYFLRQLRGPARPFIESVLHDPLLASVGMIDAPRLRHAWKHVMEHDDDEIGARLYFTVQAELWLRSRAADLPAVNAAAASPAIRA